MSATNKKYTVGTDGSYEPIPVEGFEFPVTARFVNVTAQSMHQIGWHWHEELEFIVVNNGTAHVKLPEGTVVLEPGNALFLNQNKLHAIFSEDTSDCAIYSLKFHPSALFGYTSTGLVAKYVSPVIGAPTMQSFVLRESTDSETEMLDLVNDTIACLVGKRFGYEFRAKISLLTLWEKMLNMAMKEKPQTVPATDRATTDTARIKDALTFIEENHAEQITLEQIAESIHVSKSECCRCFQRALGVTPFEYLTKYRIFESTKKITRGDEVANSISALAASVGFNNTSYYNKLFRRYLGCTPTKYKKYVQSKARYLE